MFEDIQKHRQAVAENIEKSFQIGFTESEDLQKAHNVGDVHPNGKWVWTQLPSGKYDWRVIKKTAQANAASQSNNQKAIPKKNGIELTSKGIKEYINKNSATRDERMKAMSEVYKALKDSGKNKKVDTFIKEMSSGSPSVDMTTRKYVEAINDGATHDEAVAFADKCYKEFTTNLNNFQEKVYNEGVSPSTAAKMFASATEWFKAQKFEKKAVSESSVKKDKAKLPSTGLKTISEVEDYAKSIPNVAFKNVKTGWDKEPGAKAFELTYSKGGKMVVDFLNESEFIYRLTDNTGKVIIDTNSTSENSRTDWSKQLNPSSVISERVNWMKQKLTKLKGERTKAEKRHVSHPSDFTDRYRYKQASEAVAEQEKKIKDWEGYISKF